MKENCPDVVSRDAIDNLFAGMIPSLLKTYNLPTGRQAYNYFPYISSIFFKSSSVLISATGLSFLQRLMRGNRSATPDLWRLEAAIPSKAISKTNSGFTVLTGPNFSNEFRLTK